MNSPPEKKSPAAANQPGKSSEKELSQPASLANLKVSVVKHAQDTETRDCKVTSLLEMIRTGGKNLRKQIEAIRKTDDDELRERLKRKLPAVTWSGTFALRASDKLKQHSGLLCADLDSLNGELPEVENKLKQSPHLGAVFVSPGGAGLKAILRVPADATKHAASFRAVEQYVRELTGWQIDRSGKDVARLCYLSFDPEIYFNPNATELAPLLEPERPVRVSSSLADLGVRQRIAAEVLRQEIDWQSETRGFANCPGKNLHTTPNGKRDCEVNLDGAPTVFCFHNSCRRIIDEVNRELRPRIGKAERVFETPEPNVAARVSSDLPKIQLPGDGRLLSGFAGDLAKILKDRRIYKRGGVAVIVNGRGDSLEVITPPTLRSMVEKDLICFRVKREGGLGLVSFPRTMSRDDAEGVLASPQFLERLPEVRRIATARLPVTRASGDIELLPKGYDSQSLTLTLPQCDYDAALPMSDAKQTIDDLLSEFPFADFGRSKSVAVAGMLGPFGAGLLQVGVTRPVFIYIANAEGAGKTLLAKCAISPTHGLAKTDGDLRDREETAKQLATAVIAARPYILFDNVKKHLDSSHLESFVNAPVWSGRVLGTNKSFASQNLLTVFVTGNGCTVSPDMRRRSLFVELFMEAERAEDRKFKRILDDEALLALRPQILAALWALVREWDAAGRPAPSRTHAAFPRWAEIVGGIVEFAGYGCPLETAEIKAAADTDGDDMRALVKVLADREPVKFSELVDLCREHGLFERIVGSEGELKPEKQSTFGWLLRHYNGRIFADNHHFIIDGKGHLRAFRVT